MIPAFPPPSICLFPFSGYLLRTPDNSNLFRFPKKFELSGVDCSLPAPHSNTVTTKYSKSNIHWFTKDTTDFCSHECYEHCLFRWESIPAVVSRRNSNSRSGCPCHNLRHYLACEHLRLQTKEIKGFPWEFQQWKQEKGGGKEEGSTEGSTDCLNSSIQKCGSF